MRAVFWVFSILVFSVCIRETSAQLQDEWEIPISELPEYVKYSKGKFSIFADFKHGEKGDVVIIMINDTDKEIRLPSQDGDIYLKQEARVDGKWLRSQPHRYSWCGNSYMSAPSISSRHFAVHSTKRMGWASKEKAAEKGKEKVLPVRYRFYTEAHFDVISNQGEMPVSLELIKLSEFDTMALNFGPVEKLVAVATGEVKVESLDHMKAKWTAVSRLSKFPGSSIAQDALREVIKDLYELKNEKPSRINYKVKQALGVVSKIFDAEEAQKIYLDLINDKTFPYHEEALTSLVYGVKEKSTETDSLLDGFLESFDDPFYSKALYLRTRSWSNDEKRKQLKSVYNNAQAPKEIRKYAKRLYNGMFPNPYIRLRADYSSDTSFVKVSIENISKSSFQIEYSHPYDLIASQLELSLDGEQVPYSEDFKRLVDSERGEQVNRELKPGEKLVFSDVNIWRYHKTPTSVPKYIYFRIISNLPQFGDVPAGVGSTSSLETDQLIKRKILESTIEE